MSQHFRSWSGAIDVVIVGVVCKSGHFGCLNGVFMLLQGEVGNFDKLEDVSAFLFVVWGDWF